LAGVSRKSFLGKGVPADRRGNASLAAITATILAGAHLVRVHDVRPSREAAAIADAILAASI
jgi:dihydropteroate synthase